LKPSKRNLGRETVSNRATDEWLAVLGHELRNPLAPILAVTRQLRGAADSSLAGDIDIIERQARHMVHVIENVLVAARTTRVRKQLSRRPIELRDVVDTAWEMTAPVCAQKQQNVTLDVPAGLIVQGDETRLVQATSNLLMNAAKYTGIGGHIRVEGRGELGEIVLAVTDDGIGISRALLPHVFYPFRRGARARQQHVSGCGLGLSIARELIELHGGSVSASSPGLGFGSTFTIRLPRRQRSGRARVARAGAVG
jgi:signal transduction histidine kinase